MNLSFVLKTFRPLLSALLLLWVLLGLAAQAATGPEVAQLLNTRYRNTPLDCPGNHAAYFCSGVLVSGLADELPIKFWEHTDSAIALGARSFSYLRGDLGIRSLTQKSGMLFSDPFTAISQGKTVDVLCAYPLVAAIQGSYGCGAGGPQDDPSSCAALGVSDAPGWLTHFQQQGQQPARQCSLSSRIPAQFRSSLLAHEQLGGSWVSQPNQVQVRNWNTQAPDQIPLQGLFYDATQTGGLRLAQRNQRDYFTATGQWLPILRLDLAGADGAVFGFNQQDQLYVGYAVAARLNARYFDTAMTCPDGHVAFYCNGVVLRGTEATTAFHSWNPSRFSEAKRGVSASYLRTDSYFKKAYLSQGFLFKEWAAPAANPLTMRCGYPVDAESIQMDDTCDSRALCEQLGVNSVDAWMARYSSHYYNTCRFSLTPAQLRLLMDVSERVTWSDWNEFIIAPWAQDIPERLPIDAVFYGEGAFSNNGLIGARFIQDDYFRVTGRFLPVVHLVPNAPDRQVFSFKPEDQCLAETCPAP